MFKKIAATVAVVIVAILAYATTQPDSFRVERTIAVNAPAEKVFAQINDFKQWPNWSPWEKLDPAMKRSHSGAASGPGAAYAWEGNDKVGAGRMEILAAEAPTTIRIKLDFIKPFEGHNTAEFTIAAKDGTTNITWAMFGPSPFIAKVMGVFFSMDRMIGKDFETGLANLKAAVEK